MLTSGENYTIVWDRNGTNIPNVVLEFSSNNGTNWSYLNPASPYTVSNTGSYPWVAPSANIPAPAPNCLIRVTDPNNATATASSSNFEVRAKLVVTSPTVVSEWTQGTSDNNINWTITGVCENVKIEYSKNAGTDWIHTVIGSRLATEKPFLWSIPTDLDFRTPNEARIKVSNASYATAFGRSPNFKMKGLITVSKPDAADILKIGDAFNIKWSTGGFTSGTVVLGYSKTGAAPFTNIDTVAYNYGSPAGTYPWNAPIDSITNNSKLALVEIKDSLDPNYTRAESALFEIEGKLILNSPNLDQPTWYVNDNRNIIWTPAGTWGYVKIEYSTTGGNTWETPPLSNAYANSSSGQQGSFPWTIPDKIGNNLKVKITATNDPDVTTVSQMPFIIKGGLTLTEPNGGEVWHVADTTRKVKWQASGSINTVKIEYSKNNGGAWTEIIANAPAGAGAGEYTWPQVADAISELCLIKVSDPNDSTVNDISNAVFSIKGRIQVTAPNGTERWVAQSSGHNITWTMNGSIANVKLTYSVDGGPYDNVIVESTPASNYLYTWNNLPNHVGRYRVKVADANDPDNVSVISPEFKIVGSITVSKPQGGEQLKVGTNFKVEWAKVGNFPNVRIEYSTDGGVNYNYQIVESVASDNLFYWWNNISQDTVSSNVALKITDANDIQTFATSQPFKIQGIFNITSPDGGEVWAVGSGQTITWTTVGNVTHVKLEYSIDGGNNWIDPPIAASIVNTGSRSWTIPDSISDLARIRVSDVNDSDAKDISASNFKIRGDLRITSPNAGTESWLTGTTQPITWEVTGSISKVKLEFSVDGAGYEQIPGADNLNATPAAFNWTIPDRISPQVKVKVTNKDDSMVYDGSDNNFTITGKLVLTSPTGGETWYVQEQNAISWTKTGTIPTVKLEYSVAGGAYQQIQDAENLSGLSFDWIIPNAISQQIKVRVSNTNGLKPTIPGVSGFFAIKGKLQVTNPTSGVVWDVAQQKNITWTRTGSIANIKIEYDYGTGFIQIPGADNLASNLLTFPWTIPNTIANNVVVRLSPINANEANAASSAAFKIAADIRLTSPLGGEIWIVDEQRPITWEKYGDITNIVIKYDTNEGIGGYPNTIATRAAGEGSYTWQVPDQIGTKLRVRIEDANTNSYTQPDASPINFAIRGSITITTPAGVGPNKTVWICESQQNIAYTIHGSIANVQIRYSLNGGETYPENKIIAASVPIGEVPSGGKNLTYPWTIPVDTSTRAMIKITNLASANVYDESDEFTMRGGFTFIHPVSGERWRANSSKLIEWNTFGIINYVYVEYSLNNGTNWFFVNDGSPISNSTQNYNWAIPNVISNQARIKITDINDPAATATSSNLVIHGALTLTQPNGQEKFKVGQSDTATKIKWTMIGPIAAVDLDLSMNGVNGTYTTFATNRQASLLEYQWSVPVNAISNNCFIRIRDSGDAQVEDFSDLAFKIMENLSITAPNGAEQWVVGTQPNITWSSVSFPNQTSSVIIKYSIESPYTSWTTIIPQTDNDGIHQWAIPPTISKTCRVRVSDYNDDADAFDISDNDFRIQGAITVIAPNGGEKWGCASQQWIRWSWQGNIAKVDIHYYNGTTWVTIDEAQGYNNTGEYEWIIPLIATTQAKVRVRDNNPDFRDDVKDESDNPFKIMGRVVVQVPNGAEVWYAGSNATLTWAKYGPAAFNTVKIDYSIDDPTFTTPRSIITSTSNSGTFDWNNIPAAAVSGKVRVRVAHPSDADVFDISDGDFRIRSTFTLNAPNGGQKWVVGNTQTISWSQVGQTAGVKFIYYKQSNPAINQTFTLPGAYGTGTWTHDWTIPNFIHNDLIMRIEDPQDNGTFDISDATFKLMPGFTVTLPNANSQNELDYKWYVNEPAVISWTYTGTVSDVGIYYSTAGGIEGSWVALTSVPASNLQWSWPAVPDQITAQLKVKVGAANDAEAYGVSQGMSKIRAKFALATPAGGEALVIGDTFNISWANVGTVSNVDLHYSLDNFVTTPKIIKLLHANGANGGSYSWIVPDDISHTVKARVKSAFDVDAYAISPAFRIKGSVWVIAPTTGNSWEIGQQKQIKWGWKGTIPDLKITYSLKDDNGTPGDPGDDFQGPFNPIQENVGTPNDGIVENGSGPGGPGSEYSYTWTIPDQANDNVLVKIADQRINESDVQATSNAFKIIGYLILKTPLLNDKLAVASPYRIRWEWGGTMPEVKIVLSTNGFANELQNFDLGTLPNGSGSGGPGSGFYYDWTIPDRISPNCKIRISDPRVPSVLSISPVFKIQGAFTLISPALELNNNGTSGNPNDDFYECRWITNEVREVKWTTFGTMPKVDLVYSKDNFQTEIPMVGGTNIDNVSGFNWTIPNERLSDPPYYVNVKIRIYDHNDREVYVQGPTPVGGVDTMKLDYYKITWDIRDLVTNQPIQGLKVNDTSGWIAQGLSSPVVRYVPAGFWVAEWTHKDFGPISESYLVGWDADARLWRKDRTIYRTMETLVVHIWRAYSDFSYDVPVDRLDIISWLERDGSLVSGALIIDVSIYDGIHKIKRKTTLVDDVAQKHYYYNDVPVNTKLWIGDRVGEVRTMQDVINDCAPYKTGEMVIPPNFSGFFQQNWLPTPYSAGGINYDKLQSGKVYMVATYMSLATGGVFTTPVSFTVTIPKIMAQVGESVAQMVTTVNSVLDKPISVVSAELQSAMATQTGIINTKMTEQTTMIQTATTNMQTMVESAMTSFERTVSDSLVLLKSSAEIAEEAAGLLEVTAKKYSWKASVSPDPALSGDMVTLQVQGLSGLLPMLDIYSWDNKTIINDMALKEDSTRPGLYTYEFKVNARFTPGKAYTYTITEQTTGGLVAGSGMVESMSLTTVAGLAAAAPAAERAASKALEAIKTVEAVLISGGDNINIALTLKNLKESVDALPAELSKEGPAARLNKTVDDISDRLKILGGKEGLDLSGLFEKALSTSPTVKDMRVKTDEISSVIEILKQIFEAKFGGKDTPIVSTTLAPGSVKFRIVAVNPSLSKTQKVQIKYDLPEEIRPKTIADLGGLELEYDSTRSIYYVYKNDLELTPGEVRVFEVEVEDIWLIGQDRISDLKGRVDQILARLEQTAYYSKAKEISDTIYPKLNDILSTQADDSVSRERHIGVYRQNLVVLAQVKEDIARMEKILVTAGGPASPEMLAKTKIKADEPTKTMTWIVIFIIIVFIGLLGGVLFFSWHRQSRISKEELLEAKKSSFPEPVSGPEKENEPKENNP